MKRDTLQERFWRKVHKTDGCWEWTGSRDRKGYGKIAKGGAPTIPLLAHRVSWAIHHGDPGDLCVLHRCDNPPCVRPDHLFLGTIADNNRDMTQKGRHGDTGANVTHCPKGHEYSRENTYLYRGSRSCKECRRQSVRARREAGGKERERAQARDKYWANIEESRRKVREAARVRHQKKRAASHIATNA